MKKKIWTLLAIIAVIAIAWWLTSGGKEEKKIEFLSAKVEEANLQNSPSL